MPAFSTPWRFLEARRTEEPGNASKPLTICDAQNNDLANVYSADDTSVTITREQAIANAKLIAAAPDMFAALQEIDEYLNDRADCDSDQDGYIPNPEMKLLVEVRAALEKAGARR